MMGKGVFAKKLVEAARKAGAKPELDMTYEARMGRAKEMGFDPDRIFRHESKGDSVIDEISPGGDYGGIFSLENRRAGYFDNVQDFLLRGDVADNDELRKFSNENYEESINFIKSKYREATDEQADKILDYVVSGDDWPLEGSPDWDEMSDLVGAVETADMYQKLQKTRGQIASRAGYGAVIQEDEFGRSVMLLPGNNVRSVNATFDPAKKDSRNLMAGAAPLGALGIGLMASPDNAQAGQMIGDGNKRHNQMIGLAGDVGSIQAPVNERAAYASNLAGKYNRARKERLHPLADLVLPFGEMPEELWRKRAYGDDIDAWDYVNAGLGML